MSLKICFDSQIHRVSKLPSDFNSLLQLINTIFENQLPPNFILKYLDCDGDIIMLSNERDYRNMIEEDLSDSKKSVKVFITALNQDLSLSKNSDEGLSPLPSQKEYSEGNEFYVVDKSNSSGSKQHDSNHEDEKSTEGGHNIQNIVESTQLEKSLQIVPKGQDTKVQEEHENYADKSIRQRLEEKLPPQLSSGKRKMRLRQRKLKRLIKRLSRENITQEKRERIEEKLKMMEELVDDKDKFLKKKRKYLNHFAEKKENKKAILKEAINDALKEQLFPFFSILNELKQEKNSSVIQQQNYEVQRPSLVKPIHIRIECDGCGVGPIHGIRYKCSVCSDFDFCEKCEATIDHPHPFIKLKKPEEFNFPTRRCPFRRADPIISPLGRESEVQENKGSQKEDTKPESEQKEEKNNLNDSTLQKGNSNSINVSDELTQIYTTLPDSIQKCVNNQYENLPSSFRSSLNSLLFGLPEKIFMNFRNPTNNSQQTMPGNHEEVKIEDVSGAKDTQEEMSQHSLEEKNEEKEETQKINENNNYSPEVKEKAQKLKEIFPEADIEKLLGFVSDASDLSLEDLIESHLNF